MNKKEAREIPKLKLFNTLTRKKEVFKPIKKNDVGIYTCGPTVYFYQHIGNMRCYLFEDILIRTLKFNGFNVKRVMNITDVGHLTSDADEGEDKIEKAAKKEGKKAEDIAEYYAGVFFDDVKKLNIIMPDVICKATDHIPEMIELVEKLIKKGYTYETDDGIYFDTSKFKDYGKLAKLNIEGLEAGIRTEMREKRNPTDFALWKFSEKPGLRQQEWSAFMKMGFPGWHIECSAMSMKYLGEHFDIHCGGIDHISVHHTNEIAQSESATGKKWVNYWLHSNFLTFKGSKILKSKGGLYTISELEKIGFEPLAFRYLCLTAHYRSELNFSLEDLKASQKTYNNLKNKIIEFRKHFKTERIDSDENKEKTEEYRIEFLEAINDNLNTPKALALVWDIIKDKNLSESEKYELLIEFDDVLGLDLASFEKEKIVVPSEIKKIAEERLKSRKEKNFKKSDELRVKLNKLGWKIDDVKDGYELSKV